MRGREGTALGERGFSFRRKKSPSRALLKKKADLLGKKKKQPGKQSRKLKYNGERGRQKQRGFPFRRKKSPQTVKKPQK